MRAKDDVVGFTMHSRYLSRTLVHCSPAPVVSADRLRSPLAAVVLDDAPAPWLPAVALFVPADVEPPYVVTEEDPLAPAPVAVAVERASVGGVVPACAVACPSWLLLAPVAPAAVFRVAAVPPLFVVFESDPEAPAPLAVVEAEPPTPLELPVANV